MKAAKAFFSRIDLKGFDIVAILIALLGLCQCLIVIGLIVAIDCAKLISNFWTNHEHHWLTAIFGTAVIWIALRWKKMNC